MLTACRKLVEVDLPFSQLYTESVFKNDATAISAMTEIYAKLSMDQSIPADVPIYTGIYSDELKTYVTSGLYLAYYQNSLLGSASGTTDNWWKGLYNLIYQSNDVFEGCEKSGTLTPAVKKQLMAEARFIRGFCYFYLVNYWGEVPLALTTDYTVNNRLKRSPVTEVYTQIIADLVYATDNLNVNYLSGNTVAVATDRLRPNSSVAKAFLARVYLYNKQYGLAEQAASSVIANTSVYKLETLNNVFLKTSKEAIWQLALPTPYVNGNGNAQEGYQFILSAKPSTTGAYGSLTLSDQQLAAFEANDGRLTNWVGTYVDGTVTPNARYSYAFKFKQRNSLTPVEHSTPLRLAEQYLIRSEARLLTGNIVGAEDDLNEVRLRAGLPKITGSTETTLKRDILRERQVELFTEWGHRYLDLKRTGNIDVVMQVVSPLKNGTWSSYKAYFPLALTELQNNPNLVQTKGYE